MGDLFGFVVHIIEMQGPGHAVVDRRTAEALRDALDDYLDSFPVIDLVECQVCHIFSIGECKHG